MVEGHGAERALPIRTAAREVALASSRVGLAATALVLAATLVVGIVAPV